ncbi:MAG TPA: hypothetical protein VGL37_05410 [Solirubrobacteraceae bacterium]|jgi:hypothetical protein
MTIESISHPADLAQWKGEDEDPFYLEVFGETSPVIDTTYAEVIRSPDQGLRMVGRQGHVRQRATRRQTGRDVDAAGVDVP